MSHVSRRGLVRAALTAVFIAPWASTGKATTEDGVPEPDLSTNDLGIISMRHINTVALMLKIANGRYPNFATMLMSGEFHQPHARLAPYLTFDPTWT